MTRLVFVSILAFLYNNALLLSQVPSAPKVLDAKNVSRSSFIADWEKVSGAFVYSIDVSNRRDFTTSIEGNAEGALYNSLNNVYVVDITEVEISDLDTRVYYYRVRAVSLDGASDNSSIKRVSLFKESIDFSDGKIISDEYVIPYGLDVGDVDGDGKKDIVSLSLNHANNDNNFVWHRNLSGDDMSFDSKGEVIADNYSGINISIVDVSGVEHKDFLETNNLFVRQGNDFMKKDLGFSGISKAYDVDGDGMDDIVFYNSNELGWLRNEGRW